MSITLDPQTEQRIQHQVELGHYASPNDLLNHALDVLGAEQPWTAQDRAKLGRSIDEATASLARGEGFTGEQARAPRRSLGERLGTNQQGHGIPGDQIEAMVAARTAR